VKLLEPLTLGAVVARNRVMFGPIVTNLGDDDRRFTDRHVAFYERRARGGCGVIVTEGASVHESDWPYERAPLASECGPGWEAVASAGHRHGALVIASLDHAGGQGSSAYSQRELWAPSRVPEVNTREVPKWMEADDIAAVVDGFGRAAALAASAGCDGVEINAGQHSLMRQFLSGLTNQRDDAWGTDRLTFGRQVVAAVRAAAGERAVVGLRLSCDELAPWAGITPEMAPGIAAELAPGLDYLVVVRGAIFSAEKTRADFHEPAGVNLDVCRSVRGAVSLPVFLQGSVVDPGQAEWALADRVCDAVEMTRAQLADPDLVAKLIQGTPDRIRPCIRCNQVCQVRDVRNPLISCVGEPSTGHELDDPDWYTAAGRRREVVVIGAGPAGLETARVAAARGHQVRVVERAARTGGTAAVAGPGGPLVDWLAAECRRTGVTIELGVDVSNALVWPGGVVVQCTGSKPATPRYDVVDGAAVLDVAALRAGSAELPVDGTIVVHDPIGGPIGVALAEDLGERAVLVTPDNIAANELARTGDLAPANVRLHQRGVRVVRRALLREVHPDHVVVEDRFDAGRQRIDASAVVDCGFRLPDDPWPGAALQAGDCVAPRTIHEAILDGRRAALAIEWCDNSP
jgi:2,4-dienoyl-CoA reductase (NADPH2)